MRPVYRVVVADSRKKRDGEYIENLGTYNPLTHEFAAFEADKINQWIAKGAIPTDSVVKLMKRYKAA
jgi:small subunit ribosomal protein S16